MRTPRVASLKAKAALKAYFRARYQRETRKNRFEKAKLFCEQHLKFNVNVCRYRHWIQLEKWFDNTQAKWFRTRHFLIKRYCINTDDLKDGSPTYISYTSSLVNINYFDASEVLKCN